MQAECPHCKGKYSNLSQHIHKVHLKTKNIMCDKCGMTFYHNSNLKKHQDTAHVQNMHSAPPLYPMLGPPHDMVSSKFANVVVVDKHTGRDSLRYLLWCGHTNINNFPLSSAYKLYLNLVNTYPIIIINWNRKWNPAWRSDFSIILIQFFGALKLWP